MIIRHIRKKMRIVNLGTNNFVAEFKIHAIVYCTLERRVLSNIVHLANQICKVQYLFVVLIT